MTDREKMIALLKSNMNVLQAAGTSATATLRLADSLIANGVTFATETNVGSKWIPVTERLPEHFGVFIVAIREPCKERVGKDCADFDPFEKTWLPSMCWDKGYEITHWMPLPEPPKEGTNGI